MNARNGKDLADLYAEVLGVLSEARFQSVIRKFKREINQTIINTTQTIINFINGMRFIKLKLFPIEALQASFEFMQVHKFVLYFVGGVTPYYKS